MPGRIREIPYRGDGRSNVPRRVPLSESQKAGLRNLGCAVFVVGTLLISFIFSGDNAFTGFVSIASILFLLIFFYAMRDAQGIKTITPDDAPIDKKDPAMLDDYLAQIEWKQTHRHTYAKEPEWRFRPKLAKNKSIDFLWSLILLSAMIPPSCWHIFSA